MCGPSGLLLSNLHVHDNHRLFWSSPCDNRSLPIISHALYTTCPPRRAVRCRRPVDAPARSSRRPPGRSARCARGFPRRRHVALPELRLHRADADSGRRRRPRLRGIARATRRSRSATCCRKTNEVRAQFAQLINAESGRDRLPLRHQRRREHRRRCARPEAAATTSSSTNCTTRRRSCSTGTSRETRRRRAADRQGDRDGRGDGDDFERAGRRRTRLVSVAWVSHQNGFRHDMRPLADLAHAHGALLLHRCASRRVGMFPDRRARRPASTAMTVGTYKWLLGGFGVAPFFVRRELLERIRVDRLGALHVEKELPRSSVRDLQDGQEVRLRHAAVRRGLSAGCGARLSRARRRRPDRAHTVALAHELRDGLAALGFRVFTPPEATARRSSPSA